MENSKLAENLVVKLNLDNTPVALSYVDSIPSGVDNFELDVPSACSLWRLAEKRVFYASAEKHYNCPVGAMVMGFEMPNEIQTNLMGVVTTMCECDYLSSNEPEKIPTVRKKSLGIVYGPLKDFPLTPDLVIMWLTPYQSMIYFEALGAANWTHEVSNQMFGRPACAALALAFENSSSASSMGCMGMRTFTEIDPDKILIALSGKKINEILKRLDSKVGANEKMKTFYEGHKEKFAVV